MKSVTTIVFLICCKRMNCKTEASLNMRYGMDLTLIQNGETMVAWFPYTQEQNRANSILEQFQKEAIE